MTGIFPDTEVRLISGCPIEKSHGNTIFFTSLNEQVQYFEQFPQRVFYNVSYQRENRNVFRIECPIAEVINCNYMMFKNESFENKWFFAFIDKINYVNNKTTEVEYEIDVLQSWYFNFDFHQSFVEREHTLSDKVGENIIPEPFSVDEYTTEAIEKYKLYADNNVKFTAIIYYIPNKWVCASPVSYTFTPFNPSWGMGDRGCDITFSAYRAEEDVTYDGTYIGFYSRKGNIINNVYEGFNVLYVPIDLSNAEALKNSTSKITALIFALQKDDASVVIGGYSTPVDRKGLNATIVDVSIVPTSLIHNDTYASTKTETYNLYFPNPGTQDSYVPKNNKLYCYPYQKAVVSNNQGTNVTLRWENCGNRSAGTAAHPIMNLTIEGILQPSPVISIYPTNYSGMDKDYEDSATIDASVSCTWSEDSYTRWFNTHRNRINESMISSSIKMLTAGALQFFGKGSVAHNIYNAEGAISDMAKTAATMQDMKNVPDQMYGTITSDGLRVYQDRVCFFLYKQKIKAPQAKAIDNFFTMYGYQVNELKIPNVFNPSVFSQLRPRWNYVKTQNAVITPKEGMGLPAEAEQKICEIFNNGVTFWNKDASVGDYSQNNAPVV